MNLFGDSSALAKRYVADEKSADFDNLLERSANLAVSVLCMPEIFSALCRRCRERFVTAAQYTAVKNTRDRDLEDVAIIQITDDVLVGSIRLLESSPLCASDAIQISSALTWRADVFRVRRCSQCQAAKAAGPDVVRL